VLPPFEVGQVRFGRLSASVACGHGTADGSRLSS
jgi:hypothetical protein